MNKLIKSRNLWLFIYAILSLSLIVTIIFYSGLYRIARFELGNKTNYKISLRSMAPGITTISADEHNSILFEAKVTDSSGNPLPAARVSFEEKSGLGSFYYLSSRTSGNGIILASYKPPEQSLSLIKSTSRDITISVRLADSNAQASLNYKLIRVPVVFLHGYKASPAIFSNFIDFLKAGGFMTEGLDYDSGKGVASGAVQLDHFLTGLTSSYAKQGILAYSFNVIAHSMGGLVARYYSCSSEYISKDNISKIIFISTPQKGSPFASLGLKYYKDRGIYDLAPDSELFTKTFASMINQGLNYKIRTASILGQYDEVVSAESANLDKWGIRTEMFNVGESNFTVDKLLTGKIVEAANHKLVLDNLKVYRRAEEMLLSDLPYPQKLK